MPIRWGIHLADDCAGVHPGLDRLALPPFTQGIQCSARDHATPPARDQVRTDQAHGRGSLGGCLYFESCHQAGQLLVEPSKDPRPMRLRFLWVTKYAVRQTMTPSATRSSQINRRGAVFIKTVAAIALLTIAGTPAWAIDKCTGPDGKVIFQDAPCAGRGETITVRPASGPSPSRAQAQGADAASGGSGNEKRPLTAAQRIEQQIAASQQARRKQELEVRVVPDAEFAVAQHRMQCDQQIRDLQAKRATANNNLAGATWEVSIAQEMTAIATRCDTRHRELREHADRVRAECQRLEGCR